MNTWKRAIRPTLFVALIWTSLAFLIECYQPYVKAIDAYSAEMSARENSNFTNTYLKPELRKPTIGDTPIFHLLLAAVTAPLTFTIVFGFLYLPIAGIVKLAGFTKGDIR
jgi:cytochrome c biogenesis protein CcdA